MQEKWEKWNLTANPFDSSPLVTPKELREMFVGRERELSKAQTALGSPGSRIMVEANVGIGKTTFVNKLLDAFTGTGFIVAPKVVKIESYVGADAKWKIATALAEAMKNAKTEGRFKTRMKQTLADASKLEQHARAIGLGTAGFKEGTLIGSVINQAEKIMDSVSELIPELGFKGAIIALNNFDAIPESYVKAILNEMRDFIFPVKTISFVLVADVGFYGKMQEDIPRLRGFLSVDPIRLEPFSAKDMRKIIEKRLDFFSSPGKEGRNLIDGNVVDKLCGMSHGNLRWVLSTLSTLALELVETPTMKDVMDMETALPILRTRADLMLERLTPTERRFVKTLIKHGESFSTDKKIQNDTGYKQARLSQMFNSLCQKGHLIKRSEGKKVYYSPAPDFEVLKEKHEGG